jgi:hypothetical protein
MFNLDLAISKWRRQIAAGGMTSREALDELESHLRDDMEHRIRAGASAREAFQQAAEQLGAADNLNREFAKVTRLRPRFSPRMISVCCYGFAAFVFLVEAWTLMDSEMPRAERLLGLGLVSLIACYIAGLPLLNRLKQFGVRGWGFEKTIATACNLAVLFWICLLLLSLVNVVYLPVNSVLSVVCWALFGAAIATVMMIAHGPEPDALAVWTPEAWQSFELAGAAARHFHHDFIGTEHVLLGLLESENCAVRKVLQTMGVTREIARAEIEKIVGSGSAAQTTRPTPYTPRAQKAIQLAILEAKALRSERVGAEHLFLGLMREGGGVAALVLNGLGVNAARARAEILKESGS